MNRYLLGELTISYAFSTM